MEFIISKEEYLTVKAAWTKIANRNSTDHIFYNALRGHDIKRGFAATTSDRKLSNGKKEWDGFETAKGNALWRIRLEPSYSYDTPERKASREAATKDRIDALSKQFGIEFSPELINMLRELLK
jgi:hypothetical protein